MASESLQHDTNTSTAEAELITREVFTGKRSVFNDPMLDPRLIPDDPVEREGLRVALLVSTWRPLDLGEFKINIMKINHEKLMQYYYSEYGAQNGYITLCAGYLMPGDTKDLFCYNVTQKELDKYATYQTFDFIMENVKEAFLTDMVVLPLVFIFGIFGKIFSFSFLQRIFL